VKALSGEGEQPTKPRCARGPQERARQKRAQPCRRVLAKRKAAARVRSQPDPSAHSAQTPYHPEGGATSVVGMRDLQSQAKRSAHANCEEDASLLLGNIRCDEVVSNDPGPGSDAPDPLLLRCRVTMGKSRHRHEKIVTSPLVMGQRLAVAVGDAALLLPFVPADTGRWAYG